MKDRQTPADVQPTSIDDLARVNEVQRRRLLKAFLAGSAAGMSGLLTACGGGASSDGSSSSVNGSGGAATPAAPPAAPQPQAPVAAASSAFSLMVLPDTQFYSRYASQKMGTLYQKLYPDIDPRYNNPFKAQTQWIAQNAQSLNTAFTMHLGDVVDQSWYFNSEKTSPWSASTDLVGNGQVAANTVLREWDLASQAMQVLEQAKCPYSICAGNHDVGAIGSNMQWGPDWGVGVTGFDNTDGYQDGGSRRQGLFEPYLKVFPAARAAQQSTFGGRHSSGFHEFHVFQAEGNSWLVLSMSWRASDDAIAWANQVIGQHPTLPVILINHQLMGIGPDGTTAVDTAYSSYMWDRLIKNNDQIFMAVNGHYHGSCTTTKKNAFGHDVLLMVVDYQMAYMGGNGLMRMYEFDLTNKKIVASSFSPWVPVKPQAELNNFDMAWLPDANQNFTLGIDFAARFGGFNPAFALQPGTRTKSLTQQAKETILTNFKSPTVAASRPATGPDDYPKVAGTLAHWRFYSATAAEGDLFPYQAGQQIADAAPGGANPIALNTGMGQSGDLVWSRSRHPLSSAPGSLRFLNSTDVRASYFTTAQNSALNAQQFLNGYTVEAFVYIDPAFDAKVNGWMGILYRLGARSHLPGFGSGEGDTSLMFAFSNLMEFQWEIVPTDQATNLTCWSGSVSAGQWLHVAVVNDPSASYATTMYVEGAPVLRNNSNMKGVQYVNGQQPFAVGCGQWADGMSTGFLGSLGEIRIVGAPLPPSQWLTARAS